LESIRATLPTLGEVDVTFHSEAKAVLDFFGVKERGRLDDVLHLGPAARAFTGVNHSRWEYTLLQCALIQYVGVIFKGHPHVSLKGKVRIDGPPRQVSSAEELLKSWALLGNMGHAQWTYGVERGVLKAAQEDSALKAWLIDSTGVPDLRNWIRSRSDEYDDMAMHYVLALRRVRYGAAYDRRKTLFAHILRNLVLPVSGLLPEHADDRSKLSRLRELYRRIRLLSLVTLDAYNSHKPLRVSLHTTLNSFAEIAGVGKDAEATVAMLNGMAGWLADQLYLHPEAAAIQFEYEERVARELPGRFAKASNSKRGPEHLLGNLMHNGMGSPWVGGFRPVLRLTFQAPGAHLLGSRNLYASMTQLGAQLCERPMTQLAIDYNPFSRSVHVDLLRHRDAVLSDVGVVWRHVTAWLLRVLQAEALNTYRQLVPETQRGEGTAALKRRILERELRVHARQLEEVFFSVLRHLVPPEWTVAISPFLPSETTSRAVRTRVQIDGEVVGDHLGEYVARQLEGNPDGLEPQRIHELKGLRRLIRRSSAPVLIGCPGPVRLYDGFGFTKDEWDATLLEIDVHEVRLHVFEGKSGGGAIHRANWAFDQLAETRDIVCGPHTSYRRHRFMGLGASLSVTIN